MWSKRKTSHTDEYPTPRALMSALLAELITRKTEGAWVHFEVVSNRGWFKNLLFGKAPWMEIAMEDGQILQLNLGLGKPCSPLPAKWKQEKGLALIPISDLGELMDWMTSEFARVSGSKDFQLTGWMEGL